FPAPEDSGGGRPSALCHRRPSLALRDRRRRDGGAFGGVLALHGCMLPGAEGKLTMAGKTVSADSGSTLRTLANLWPYMWPSDRADLRMRVVWATVYLVLSKLVLVAVPYFFKW